MMNEQQQVSNKLQYHDEKRRTDSTPRESAELLVQRRIDDAFQIARSAGGWAILLAIGVGIALFIGSVFSSNVDRGLLATLAITASLAAAVCGAIALQAHRSATRDRERLNTWLEARFVLEMSLLIAREIEPGAQPRAPGASHFQWAVESVQMVLAASACAQSGRGPVAPTDGSVAKIALAATPQNMVDQATALPQ